MNEWRARPVLDEDLLVFASHHGLTLEEVEEWSGARRKGSGLPMANNKDGENTEAERLKP